MSRHCELCEDDGADTFCRDCNYFFCPQCCEAVHDDPARSHHVLSRVSTAPSPSSAAPAHRPSPAAVSPHLPSPTVHAQEQAAVAPAAAAYNPPYTSAVPSQYPDSAYPAGHRGHGAPAELSHSNAFLPPDYPPAPNGDGVAAVAPSAVFSFSKSQDYHSRQSMEEQPRQTAMEEQARMPGAAGSLHASDRPAGRYAYDRPAGSAGGGLPEVPPPRVLGLAVGGWRLRDEG